MANTNISYSDITPEIEKLAQQAIQNSAIPSALFSELKVNRGLRAVSYTHLDVYKRQG